MSKNIKPPKAHQLDLEEYLAKKPQRELPDAVTGEMFQPRARNHYEDNDGVPFAPPVEFNRPTLRQRVENLLNRGIDPMAAYVGTDGYDLDVPDDPDEPLTLAETLYIDAVSASLSEAAPLPDEGMPRPSSDSPATPPAPAPNPPTDGPRPPASGSAAPPANSTVPSR